MMKDSLKTFCCIFLINFNILQAKISTIHMTENVNYQGKFTSYKILGEYKTTTLLRCINQCLLNVHCLSLFYRNQTEQCRLYDYEINIALSNGVHINIVTESGWRYYNKTEISNKCKSYPGFTYAATEDICYFIGQPVTLDFDDINRRCSALNSELIRIDSAKKQSFIESVLALDSTDIVCIQGNNDNDDKVYKFDDGTAMQYFNWNSAGSQPDGGSEHHIIMRTSSAYRWHDVDLVRKELQCTYICEA